MAGDTYKRCHLGAFLDGERCTTNVPALNGVRLFCEWPGYAARRSVSRDDWYKAREALPRCLEGSTEKCKGETDLPNDDPPPFRYPGFPLRLEQVDIGVPVRMLNYSGTYMRVRTDPDTKTLVKNRIANPLPFNDDGHHMPLVVLSGEEHPKVGYIFWMSKDKPVCYVDGSLNPTCSSPSMDPIVARPFHGTPPDPADFFFVADVGATAYFPGARVVIEGRAGLLIDLRVTTTKEKAHDLHAFGVPEGVILAAERSEPKGLVVCFNDENPEP